MAFVRYKMVKGRKYYQYVRNYREGGKHKQEVLCHLGQHDSLEGAIDYAKDTLLTYSEAAVKIEEEADSTKGYLLEFHEDVLGGEIPSVGEAREMYERGELLPAGEEGQRLAARWQHAYELLRSIFDYHDAKWRAELCREFAEEHQAKLAKFTRVQQEYS